MTARVFHLDDYRTVWRWTSLECDACHHRWQGLTSKSLSLYMQECPKCHMSRSTPLAVGATVVVGRGDRKKRKR